MDKKITRCFVAIDLPRSAINEIIRIQDLIKKKNMFAGKFTEPENLHLTLKFLGDVDDDKIGLIKENLDSAARKFVEQLNSDKKDKNYRKEYENDNSDKKIQAELGATGVFTGKNPKILWIKLNGKIFGLQKYIDDSLKDLFEPEFRFMSHITIARIKHLHNKKEFFQYLKSIKPKKISFEIDKFFLKKSELKPEGPVYTDIQDFRIF